MYAHSPARLARWMVALFAVTLLAAIVSAPPLARADAQDVCAPLPPNTPSLAGEPQSTLFAAYLSTCHIADLSLATSETKHFALKLYPGITTLVGAVPMGSGMNLTLTVTPPAGANVTCTGSSNVAAPVQSDGFLLCGTTTQTQDNFIASVTAAGGSGRFLVYEISESVAASDVGMYSVQNLAPSNVLGHTLKLYKIAKDSRVFTMKLRVKDGGPNMYARMYGRNGQTVCASSSEATLDAICNVSLTGVDAYYVVVLNASTQTRSPSVKLRR